MSDEALVKEWLDECRTESTKISYTFRMRMFQEWYQKPLSTFLELEPKDMRHIALTFQSAMIEKGIKPNTVAAMVSAVGSFVTQNGKTLMLRGKRLRIQVDLDSHVFTNGDLASMFDLGTVQEKAILATLTSLGWEVGSVLNLKRTFINSLIVKAREDRQQFIYFHDQRKKTGSLRLAVLNPLAIEWLERWFREWQGERIFLFKTKEGINDMLRRLAKSAQIKTTGRIHSHLLRKWVMSGLSRAGFNDFQIKYVMGKTIPIGDSTYLQTLDEEIAERYPKAYENYLTLKPQKVAIVENTKTVQDLKAQIADMERKFREMAPANKFADTLMRLLENDEEKQKKFEAFLKRL